MLDNLPFYIPLLFIVTTLVTLLFLIAAVNKNNSNKTVARVLVIIIIWMALHAVLGFTKFYTVTNTLPPRFALMVAPAFLLILILFVTQSGRRFIDSLSMKILTQLHVVRIFIEVILWGLFLYKYIPRLMTFEGRNFDILSGLTAPFIAYYGFVKRKLSNTFMLVWNIICLLLLINIVVNAVSFYPLHFSAVCI
ncbi:MAG: hypothetical protein WKF59_15225 [Chitinophagaceae bacterium]